MAADEVTPAAEAASGDAVSALPVPVLRKALLPPLQQSNSLAGHAAKSSAGDSAGYCASPGGMSLQSPNAGERPSRTKRSFKEAGTAVKLSIRAASGFTTLRDMGGHMDIGKDELKVLRKLGEGAFAIVEEAQYTPRPAPELPGSAATPGSAAATPGAATPTSAAAIPAAPPAMRHVAVKRLKPEIVNQHSDLASFVQEVSLLRKLAHKRVVEFIGIGSSDTSSDEARKKTMFLVQEYMDGGTLKKLLSRQMINVTSQVYSFEDAFRWGLHIAEGLEYLHSALPVVIHRDLKLENVLLKGTDPHTADAKIADFGLVALVRPRDRAAVERLEAAAAASLERQPTVMRGHLQKMMSTRQKVQTVQDAWNESFKIVHSAPRAAQAVAPQDLSGRTGSYMYMAPEVYRQEAYNEKVDVYSFGVIFFELLTRYQTVCAISIAGTPEEIEAYADKVSKGYRPPLPTAWPEPVRQLIADLWHQEPAQRPTMGQARQRILELQAQGVPAAMQAAVVQPMCACAIM